MTHMVWFDEFAYYIDKLKEAQAKELRDMVERQMLYGYEHNYRQNGRTARSYHDHNPYRVVRLDFDFRSLEDKLKTGVVFPFSGSKHHTHISAGVLLCPETKALSE